MSQAYPKLSAKHFLRSREHFFAEKKTAVAFPLHSHDYFELELVLEGNGTQILNGKEYGIERGSLYLLTPSDFHRVDISEENTVWNLAFDGSFLSADIKEKVFSLKDKLRHLTEEETTRADRVMSVLADEREDRERVAPLFEYLLGFILPDGKSIETGHIRRAVIFIETYFRESPSLERTAREVGLSTAYFGNLFKSTMGVTYVSYLNRCKINCAKMLLEDGRTVTETCFDSGFGSLSGFLYTFRKEVGTSPESYRKTHFTAKKV